MIKKKYLMSVPVLLLAASVLGCSNATDTSDTQPDTSAISETTEQSPVETPPPYETQYLPITEITMTPVDALPGDAVEALHKASPIGWDPEFLVFEDGLTFYIRRFYAVDLDESSYMATIPLPVGYTDGRIVYISRGGGSGEIDFYVKATNNGASTYLNYYFRCAGYEEFVTLPQQARIVPDDEANYVSAMLSDVSERKNNYIINGFDISRIDDYPEIEAAIRESIGKETGELTKEDFLKVEKLDIHESGVKDIYPLQALINLTYLSANGNNITDLAPLHNLTKLETILLVGNGIADISPLVGLKNLRTLHLDGNNISHFTPLSGLTGLTYLSLEDTGISDLSPLSGLVNLTDARLCNNEIADLTPIAGWEKIERLCFSFNPVTDVTVLDELDTLIEVKMVYCPVEDLSPVAHLIVEYAEPTE